MARGAAAMLSRKMPGGCPARVQRRVRRDTSAPMPAPGDDSTWFLSRRLFLCGVAFVYAIAFGSLALQVQGLFGSRGIAPVAQLLEQIAAQREGWLWLQFPTLLWLDCSDAMLSILCIAGTLLAAVAMSGVLPRVLLAACWILYLSLACVGYPFLHFQWDALLLETGLLAIAFAPDGVRPHGRGERAPSRAIRWLVYWLLFRLLMLSGLLKLCSGDASWRDGTALDFHFWTQPLPHRLSHHAHWMGSWCHALSVWLMFAIEVGAPLLLFVPWAQRRCRQVLAGATVFLMVAIAATGNYGFFNLLTAVLCVPLLDDRAWRAILRRPLPPTALPEPPPPRAWRRWVAGSFAAIAVTATLDCSLASLAGPDPPAVVAVLHTVAAPVAQLVEPLESFNPYGLFRVMTRERPELLIEGSDDGVDWKPYGFRYKPLQAECAPVFAGLYMPRLDWQLWFAALAQRLSRESAWTLGLLQRLLEGSLPVLDLLGDNPFPAHPPRQVRIRIAQYTFSTPDERRAGRWWRVGEAEPYSGAWTLANGELQRVR